MPIPVAATGPGRHTSEFAYRSDVDGLRALAVLAVIGFHANSRLLPGGFAGVDIFFVISGFLISSLISKQVADGTFSLRGFYTRRMKRILPAFTLVCLCTSLVCLYLLNVNDLIYFTTSLSACWVFASNIFFALLSAGYFDQRLGLFPLLHTWSLGVEEQFYFVYPLLLALLLRHCRRYLLGIALVAAVGFVLLSQLRSASASTYFLLQYRAHELLIGLIALQATLDYPIKKTAAANVICAAGLALTLGSLYWLNADSGIPGLNSLYPCVGAALVIYSGAQASLIRPLLSNRPIVLVGLLSYSLYLWHWPLFVFLRYRGVNLSAAVTLAAIASTFALSYLSWRFIERPIRANRSLDFQQSVLRLYVAPATLFVGFAVYAYASGGIPQRVSPEVRELMASYAREVDLSRTCSQRAADPVAVALPQLVAKCSFGDLTEAAPAILLFGDSHASHFKPFVEVLAQDAGLRAVYHVMGGCRPLRAGDRDDEASTLEQSTCQRHNQQMLALAQNFRFVVLAGEWKGDYARFELGLANAVAAIMQAGSVPVVFRDSPAGNDDYSQCVLRRARGWLPPQANCNIPLAAVRERQAGYDDAIESVKAQNPGMLVVDSRQVLCDTTECMTRIGNLATTSTRKRRRRWLAGTWRRSATPSGVDRREATARVSASVCLRRVPLTLAKRPAAE